jgi:hypothetical protein
MVCLLLVVAGCGRFAFEPATHDALGCTPPFTSYPTGCFTAVPALATWDDAAAACDALESKLAVLHSKAEGDQLVAIAAGARSWIGATDRGVELTFEWVDGSAFDYAPWALSEPNADDKDCVELLTNGEYNEEYCFFTRASICER